MKALLLGNEAVARGAWEAGARVASSYPGTPSTEITEALAKYPEINCEWATNEKVAMEVAYGAAIAGARAITCMKHVGLNVAADPLFTAAYTGVRAGLVVVVADDPGMFSSQNEQDSRFYGRSAHLPVLEPSDSEECRRFTKLAFEMSERYDTPVLLRLTTRVAHARSVTGADERAERALAEYTKDAAKYLMLPANARARHLAVEAREQKLAAEGCAENRIELRGTNLGVVCAGVCYNYVREAMPEASVLKLALTYPLGRALIEEFAVKVDKLIVVEELEPFLEDAIRAMGIPATGKEITGLQGEVSMEKLLEFRHEAGDHIYSPAHGETARGFQAVNLRIPSPSPLPSVGGLGSPLPNAKPVCQSASPSTQGDICQPLPLPARPPALCPGCPHRATFVALKPYTVFGDIGCYTLGAAPPLASMDTTLCMGASVGMAFGAEKARGRDFAGKSVAVIGDSTFLHSGVTALIDAVYNGGTITVVILDNRITGMTGHQQNPASGKDIHGNPAPKVNLAELCVACGVENVRRVNPFDLKALRAILREETAREGVSVILAEAPCALQAPRKTPLRVADCSDCGACLRIGCPALRKAEKSVEIDASLCVGCGLCKSICPHGGIL